MYSLVVSLLFTDLVNPRHILRHCHCQTQQWDESKLKGDNSIVHAATNVLGF